MHLLKATSKIDFQYSLAMIEEKKQALPFCIINNSSTRAYFFILNVSQLHYSNGIKS